MFDPQSATGPLHHASGSEVESVRLAHQFAGSFAADLQLTNAAFDSGLTSVSYAVSMPKCYTASYAYPLIVWFHDNGDDEQDVLDWLPRISPQNYVGLGLRAPLVASTGVPGTFRWSTGTEHLCWLEDDVAACLSEVCQRASVHSERIVVAGIGRGATIALRLMLQRPEWFSVAVCLNAELPGDWRLDWWGQYIGRKLWLGHSDALSQKSTASNRPAITAARTLHAAGMDVTPRHYAPGEWPCDTFAREIDSWLMNALCGNRVIA